MTCPKTSSLRRFTTPSNPSKQTIRNTLQLVEEHTKQLLRANIKLKTSPIGSSL
ncbi:MAG: hypothetical protein MZU97_20325 [Bacillus subtilis]|nr:hypothetical protein [Bacillus subtilis]